MFESWERGDDTADHVWRASPERRIGRCAHDVLDVMRTENLEIALATDFLTPAGDGRDDLIAIEIRSTIEAATHLLSPRKAKPLGSHRVGQRGHARIIEIEECKVVSGLILKNPAFCRQVFVDRVVPVLMIHGHIKNRRHPGMETLDRFQLETGDLDR